MALGRPVVVPLAAPVDDDPLAALVEAEAVVVVPEAALVLTEDADDALVPAAAVAPVEPVVPEDEPVPWLVAELAPVPEARPEVGAPPLAPTLVPLAPAEVDPALIDPALVELLPPVAALQAAPRNSTQVTIRIRSPATLANREGRWAAFLRSRGTLKAGP